MAIRSLKGKGRAQMYLVGDPVQLPATVISARASAHAYDRSLFKRLQQSGFPVQACPQPRFPRVSPCFLAE